MAAAGAGAEMHRAAADLADARHTSAPAAALAAATAPPPPPPPTTPPTTTATPPGAQLLELPDELLVAILGYADVDALFAAGQSHRRLARLAWDRDVRCFLTETQRCELWQREYRAAATAAAARQTPAERRALLVQCLAEHGHAQPLSAELERAVPALVASATPAECVAQTALLAALETVGAAALAKFRDSALADVEALMAAANSTLEPVCMGAEVCSGQQQAAGARAATGSCDETAWLTAKLGWSAAAALVEARERPQWVAYQLRFDTRPLVCAQCGEIGHNRSPCPLAAGIYKF